MNVMVKLPQETEEYEPTQAEHNMARGVHLLLQQMLKGQLNGIAVCAVNSEGEESAFYLNNGKEDILRSAIERLRTMYETNRAFGRADTTPRTNRSYRSH